MDSYLPLTLTIFLMVASGHCYSESMSCSTVNGQTVCERQRGNGNTAGAFSGAFSGQDGAYQDASAMAGSTLTGQSQSSRTVVDGQTRSNTGHAGISTSGFAGNSNNNGFPGPAFGGFAVADPSGNSFYGGDGQTFRGIGVPNFYQNINNGWMRGSGHLIGSGASEASSFRSNTGHAGISTSGFAGNSNNNGFPGPAFGGIAVADPSGNSFYGGGNTYGGGYAHGYGNPNAFDAVNNVLSSSGMRAGFPFNIFGRRR